MLIKRQVSLLVGVIVMAALMPIATRGQAQETTTLARSLQDRPLKEVMSLLKLGRLGPPSFANEKGLKAGGNEDFAKLREAVRKDRDRAIEQKFSGEEYAGAMNDVWAYFSRHRSYMSILLSDCAKRLLLEWAQAKLIAARDVREAGRVRVVINEKLLPPDHLKTLFGPKAKPEWLADALSGPGDLNTLAQRLWQSHGYDEEGDGQKGTAQVLREHLMELEAPTSVLAAEYKPVALALRVLLTERLRVVGFNGTFAFLSRGGDVSQVNLEDIRYFHSIMPPDAARRFSLGAVFTEPFNAHDLLLFLGRAPVAFARGQVGQEAPWVACVLN